MIFIWFIYGLAFFVLGLAIIIHPKKGSAFKLANHIWLIAGFGILHGINEWLDMFIAIGEPFPPDILKFIRLITLVGSFLFLFRFGTKVIAETSKKYRILEVFPISLFIVWAIIFLLSKQRLLIGDVSSRYLLCAPGAVLTAIGLFLQIPQFKKTKLRGVTVALQLSGITFLLYAVLAGLIVKGGAFFPANYFNYDMFIETFGMLVQIFRALCAIILACTITYVLSVFHWETQQAQKELDKYRSEMEKNTWLTEVGTMGSTMAQQLNEPLAVTRLLLQRILSDLDKSAVGSDLGIGLKKSFSEVSKAAEIVGRFRSVTRLSDKAIAKPIDLYQITKRILAVFAQSAQHVNLRIVVKDMDDIMPCVSIPARQLEQVFFNLVQNAIDTTNTIEQQKLTISCHKSDKQLELRFSDTCGGIAPEKLQHIFDPLLAAGSADGKTNFSLAIARQIVCTYDGEIIAESRPGRGTTFHVKLPIEHA